MSRGLLRNKIPELRQALQGHVNRVKHNTHHRLNRARACEN
jgi:hypothetical protein